MTALWVALGAAIGAPARYLIDYAVRSRYSGQFPWGTFIVNLIGSFVLGGLTGAGAVLPSAAQLAAGVGLCGALTTYSTFSYETLTLLRVSARFAAVVNVAGTVLGGLAVALLATMAARALYGG